MTKEQIFPIKSQMDAAIDTIMPKMYNSLEAASIDHFLKTGKVNGSFREKLYDVIKTVFMLVDIKHKTGCYQELAKERERAGKLVELLKEVDKSLYIGDDLNDIDILHWYINVITVIKDEIKQTLNDYDTATKES